MLDVLKALKAKREKVVHDRKSLSVKNNGLSYYGQWQTFYELIDFSFNDTCGLVGSLAFMLTFLFTKVKCIYWFSYSWRGKCRNSATRESHTILLVLTKHSMRFHCYQISNILQYPHPDATETELKTVSLCLNEI